MTNIISASDSPLVDNNYDSSNQYSDKSFSKTNDNNSNLNSQNNVTFTGQDVYGENEHFKSEISRLITELEESLTDCNKNKLYELKKKAIEQELRITKIENLNEKFKQQVKNNKSEIQLLKDRNSELENEASNYQSALGVVTNFKMSDDDENNIVQLNQDILSLQDKIENDYVTNLAKSKVDVKIEEIAKLLPLYKCQIKIDLKKPDKQFTKAILQRHVLEKIFEFANHYFSCNKEDHHYLESDVVRKVNELYELMERFVRSRDGTDEITKVTPIKLRQLIYTTLGMRGLGDIVKPNKPNELCTHEFVGSYTKKLNDLMNQYRVIIDPKKKERVNGLAEDLIREVFRIFYFRLKIQEPIVQYRWFKCGDKVNKTYMQVNWDDDEIDELVVELCTFPLIYQDKRIVTLAKVFTRHADVPKSSILQNNGDFIGRARHTNKSRLLHNIGRVFNIIAGLSDTSDESDADH